VFFETLAGVEDPLKVTIELLEGADVGSREESLAR
jgi:hypothetical protein